MLSPAGYYDRCRSITVPAIDGGINLATSLRVDRHRLGAQQLFVDERYKLGRKVENDHPSQAGVFRFHRGLNGSLISMRAKGAPWTA